MGSPEGGKEGGVGLSLDVWKRVLSMTQCPVCHLSLFEIATMPSTAVLEGTGPGTKDLEMEVSQSAISTVPSPCAQPIKMYSFSQQAPVFSKAWAESCPSLAELCSPVNPFSGSSPQTQTGSRRDSFPSWPLGISNPVGFLWGASAQPLSLIACWFQSLSYPGVLLPYHSPEQPAVFRS